MPRARLRPDFERRNYTYDCQIRGPVPQAVWDTARAMQTLWNGLVERHDALTAPWDIETTHAEQRAGYTTFWQEAYSYVRDEGDRLALPCWPKWHIYESFQAAQRRWTRHLGGKPRAHHGLRTILVPHRTDAGGVPTAWLWRDTPSKHTALLPPDPGHHPVNGYTTVGGTRIPLRIFLHRPFPDGAMLKRIALLGHYEPSFRTERKDGWQWRIQFALEIPPFPQAPRVGRSGGLDLGWRVQKDGLRIAVLTDGMHCWEWRLPWDMANARQRRRQTWGVEHGLPALETTGNWQRLWAWQGDIDAQLDACKRALLGIEKHAWPDAALQLWQGHVKMRAGGLRRLARMLQQHDIAVPLLEAWLMEHTLRQRRFRGAQLRLLRQRNSLYRLLADWLARSFDVLSWEGDLNLKKMAEDVTDQIALEHAKKYRQMAGLSVLRQDIREALAKRGRRLVETPAAWTTRRCSVEGCDGLIVPTAALQLQCSNGHWEDTDVNSAANLWVAIPRAIRSTSRIVPLIDRVPLERSIHVLA